MPWILLFLGIVVGTLIAPRLILTHRYAGNIVAPQEATRGTAAIVFGAGLRRDGTPTQVLADRVAAAVNLHHQGTVRSLLLSGSTHGASYDEAEAMRNLAIRLGVEPSAILVDKLGFRTLETCLRARQAFGIQTAVLVTQRFHLPRALALCEATGIQAQGVPADLTPYSSRSRWLWEARELPASLVALIESARLRATHPLPAHSAAHSRDSHES